MPDSGFIFLSLASLVLGASLFLYPKVLLKLSGMMNRTMAVLDDQLIRHRYVIGLLAFIASYALFKLALMLPTLR